MEMPMTLTHLPAPAGPAAVPRLDLVLVGARGQVGTAFRHRLAEQQAAIARRAGLDLRLLAAFDRRGFAYDLDGLAPAAIESTLRPRREEAVDALFAHLQSPRPAAAIVVDCTASDAIAARYPEWLSSGLGIATANKRANARELAFYRQIQRAAAASGAPYRFETTVGAAIPILGPLRDLALRGEGVRAIQGVLSGSLSFLLERLHRGQRFSEALAEAQRLGYTEPDAGEDLRAEDLVRKLLVLAREAGFAIEPHEVSVTPFAECATTHPHDWAQHLDAEDARWASRIANATATGKRWAILAEVDASGARIALRELDATSPFATLPAGQNLVRIETDLQNERPLWLGGPGAGPDITAAGVLSDVITAGQALLRGTQFDSRRRSVAA
jgi:aspartokinase/homoserine dehydrogenase 1